MFEISDVMVDKEEVAMTLNIRLELPAEGCVDQEEPTMEHEVIVSDELSSVSKSHIEIIMQKMAQTPGWHKGFRALDAPLSLQVISFIGRLPGRITTPRTRANCVGA